MIVCDICGATSEDRPGQIVRWSVEMSRPRRYDTESDGAIRSIADYDLCHECSEKLCEVTSKAAGALKDAKCEATQGGDAKAIDAMLDAIKAQPLSDAQIARMLKKVKGELSVGGADDPAPL